MTRVHVVSRNYVWLVNQAWGLCHFLYELSRFAFLVSHQTEQEDGSICEIQICQSNCIAQPLEKYHQFSCLKVWNNWHINFEIVLLSIAKAKNNWQLQKWSWQTPNVSLFTSDFMINTCVSLLWRSDRNKQNEVWDFTLYQEKWAGTW